MDVLQIIKDKLIEARDTTEDLLTENGHLKVTIISRLNTLINNMDFLQNKATKIPNHTFSPLTHFMGEKIESSRRIEPQMLSPKEEEKRIYLEKVEKQEDTFLSRTTKSILESNSLPEDEMVLRGIAKRAGIEDYKTSEIDESFIELIKKAMQDKIQLGKDYKLANDNIHKR